MRTFVRRVGALLPLVPRVASYSVSVLIVVMLVG